MPKLTLAQLLDGLQADIPQNLNSLSCKRLVLDSREIDIGDVFVALSGTQVNGRQFVQSALAKGAIAALIEEPNHHRDALEIFVPKLREKLSLIAGRLYDEPSLAMPVYGVTGTNGKTTIAQLLGAALTQLSGPCAVMGTLGNGLYGDLSASRHTTPDAISLQQQLANLVKCGAQQAAMEVSSHGLDQGRVEAIAYKVAIFTNLTRDHLDYHLTMENYGAAKRRLFTWPSLQHVVINADDAFGRQLLADKEIHAKKWAYGIRPQNLEGVQGYIHAERIHYSHDGILAEIITPWGRKLLQSPLLGEFNLSNLLAALTALCAQGYSLDDVAAVLGSVKPIAGRMERFGDSSTPMIVVDYAHTPDALEKALLAVRLHTNGKVAVVFGCGGDRDKGKRAVMGAIAEKLADIVVLSNDNPRSEKPEQIADDIRAGMSLPESIRFIEHRPEAIAHALAQLTAHDGLLLAGKGHETYMEINGERTAYSEVNVVRELLGGRA